MFKQNQSEMFFPSLCHKYRFSPLAGIESLPLATEGIILIELTNDINEGIHPLIEMIVKSYRLAHHPLCMLAFYLTNSSQLNELNRLLIDEIHSDAFIVSSNRDLLVKVAELNSLIRTVYDVRTIKCKDAGKITQLIADSQAAVLWIDVSFDQASMDKFAMQGRRFWVDNILYQDSIKHLNTRKVIHSVVVPSEQRLYNSDVFQDCINPSLPLKIAHRGTPFVYPENSYEGLLESIRLGADIIELDIHHTLDNHLIVMHDHTTLRSTGIDFEIEKSSYNQLFSLRLSNTSSTIPSLNDFLSIARKNEIFCFVEIKSHDPNDVILLKQLLTDLDNKDNLSIISFISDQLTLCHVEKLNQPLGLLNDFLHSDHSIYQQLSAVMKAVAPQRLHFNPHYSKLTKDLCDQLILRAVPIWPWTVDSPDDWGRMSNMHVDGITTNNVAGLISYMEHKYGE